MTNEKQTSQDRPAAILVGGPWSLDFGSWHFTWSVEAGIFRDPAHPLPPSLWEALGFIDSRDLPAFLTLAAGSIQRGDAFEVEVRLVRADGGRSRAHVSGWVVDEATHRPRMLEGMVRGLPETEELPPDGQAEAARLAAALRDWEVFARAIPHELRAPLAVIDGFAGAVLESEGSALSERARRHLHRIRQTAAHAWSLADALLVLAPLALQEMRHEVVDLSALGWQFIDVMRSTEGRRSVEVTIQPGMAATGDPDLLRMLVANLLGNAWKFTSTRTLARIDFRMVAAGADQAFCVRDNGIGFDMADSHHLFSPLARPHGAGERRGPGLGLSIARGIVERHAGRIWAQAEPGKGSCFFFVLGLEDVARATA